MEFPKSSHRTPPHFLPIRRRDIGDSGILEDASGEEFHDVEGGADDVFILAEADGAGDGDVGVVGEGVDDVVFAVYAVGGAGEEAAGGLFAQDVFVSGFGGGG